MFMRRYSVFFSLSLLLLSLGAVFAFVTSAKQNVTVEQCEKLGFPVLLIETDKNSPIKRKDKYVKASYRFGEFSGRCKIRGHGNSTWKTPLTQKKPYLLKLDDPRPLAGFPSSQKWILMANALDRSMLRNYYAEHLAHTVWDRMPWSPSSEFITLFINGKYLGLYGLTEKIDIAENRISFAGKGFLAEIDSHDGRPYSFRGIDGLNFHIRQPESSMENYVRWSEKILELEHILYTENGGGNNYRQYFDEASFVDWYLLAEFSKNYDAKFYNSVFMTYDYDRQKLFMGPAWDHDIAFGNTAKSSTGCANGYTPLLSDSVWISHFHSFDPEENSTAAKDEKGFLINQDYWYNKLFGDEAFVRAVKDRYRETRPALEESLVWLKAQANRLTEAAELNDSVWHIIGSAVWPRAPGYRNRKTYQSETDYLIQWCENRMHWLDTVFLE